MARIQKPIDESAVVHIESVSGSLQIKGWDEGRLSMEASSEEDLHYTLDGDSLTLSADGDCILRIPAESTLHIASVSKNAYVQGIQGDVHVESVNGSLTLKGVGETHIESVDGNLIARGIEGDIQIDEVSGNVSLRDVEGDVQVDEAHGNFALRNVEGSVSAKSDGNAELRLQDDGNDVSVEAGGNLFCSLDDDIDANVSMESDANSIRVNMLDEKRLVQSHKHELTLGDGGVNISLKAGGIIDFRSGKKGQTFILDFETDLSDDMGDLAENISEQVTSQVESQLESLNAQLETLASQLKKGGERGVRHAQRRVEQVKRQLERRLEHQHLRGRGVPGSSLGNRKAEPVSEKERMLILQMVQEKKISVEQAEMLLNMIEGRTVAPAAPAAPTLPEAPATAGEEND